MAQKMLPIGIESFEEIRQSNYYYVDKTLFVRDLLDNLTEVSMFTRPSGFGKTLTMRTLQAFFEIMDRDNSDLFRGLNIEQAGDAYWAHHNKYPVLFLTLRNIEGNAFEEALGMLAARVSREADRHRELEGSPHLSQDDIALYKRLRARAATTAELGSSLIDLCNMLEKHHGERVVILIDEYDVPLDKAFLGGYYAQMVAFMRIFLGEALKSNTAMRFAVLTGCLRISRESIFTGLNNIKVLSIRDVAFREYFGFTRSEVEAMLTEYGVAHRIEDAKGWYDGYRFRNLEIYNPWDIINFCYDVKDAPDGVAQSYWLNTSGNDFILRFIQTANANTRKDIERLIDGQAIRKRVRMEITYGEIDEDPENLWSFLLLTGYLTIEGEDNGEREVFLRIPNAEIREVYIEKISYWFREKVGMMDLTPLYTAILEGDGAAMERLLKALLLDTISYHDSRESFYHGFLAGLLRGCAQWSMSSNQEAGYGRSDILLETFDMTRAAVIEMKAVQSARELDTACKEAIEQIRSKAYTHPLEVKGYERIDVFGIAFYGKTCRVLCERG